MFSVYMHTCPNDKVYIGLTSQEVTHRWGASGINYRGNRLFTRAIKKYGWNNIKHEVIADNLTKEQAIAMEIKLIAKYDSTNPQKGYNITKGGEGTFGVYPSIETRKKMSAARTGEKNPNYGKKFSEERRRQMSERQKGEKSVWYGRKHTPEELRKMSENQLGEKNHAYGKHPSLESRAKMSASRTGSKNHMYGKNHTEESKRKMSEVKKSKHRKMPQEVMQMLKTYTTKPVTCIETGEVYGSVTEAGAAMNVTSYTITRACTGKQDGVYLKTKVHFRYLTDEEKKEWRSSHSQTN